VTDGRSQETVELAALRERAAKLEARVDEFEREQREAVQAAGVASQRLADVERRAGLGEKVSAATRRDAEHELMRARAAAAEPWAERIAGARAAARDARAAVQAFVGQNLEPLVAELEQDGERAAQAVDDAARALLAAYGERMAVEQQVWALISMVRPSRPGDIERTRSESLVDEARRLLAGDGERPPRLLVDPRAPRHAAQGAAA
jgi:hypothetical protein